MAYMNQEKKKALAPSIKKVLAKYGMKGTISVRHSMALCVTLSSGALDLIGQANRDNKEIAERTGKTFFEVEGNYQANAHNATDTGDETIANFFRELVQAMKGNIWYDNSDMMTDYFNTAYYIHINVGRFDKPYIFTGEE
jgi:hypothetical protein